MGMPIKTYASKSKPGKEYTIYQSDDKTHYYCDCWQWKQNKTCSHLTDFMADLEGPLHLEELDAEEAKMVFKTPRKKKKKKKTVDVSSTTTPIEIEVEEDEYEDDSTITEDDKVSEVDEMVGLFF